MKFEFARLRLDEKGYLKSLDRATDKIVQDAAREFLTVVDYNVPTWTGTSRGTLRPAAKFLGLDLPDIIPSDSKGATQAMYEEGLGPEAGEEMSSYSFKKNSLGVLIFEWSHEVDWFARNDLRKSDNKHLIWATPWRSLPRGKAAAAKVLKAGLDKIPNPGNRKYLKFIGLKREPTEAPDTPF